MTVQSGISYFNDPRYREAAQSIQQGEWKVALRSLRDLAKEYPNQQDISALIEEVIARERLEAGSIVGRSPLAIYFLNRRRLTALAVMLLLAILALSGWIAYTRWLAPVRAMRLEQATLVRSLYEGQVALAESRYEDAAQLFEQALTLDPDNPSAQQGLEKAQRQISLARLYNLARSLEEDDPLRALQILHQLQEEEPGYRDVVQRIERIQERATLQEQFQAAEEAYQSEEWERAIDLYTMLRSQDLDYQAVTVQQHLFESYRNQARLLMDVDKPSRDELERAIQNYRMALTLQPRDREARLNVELLSKHLEARRFMDEDRFAEAALLLSAIHSVDPNFLRGDNRRALYYALLQYGGQLQDAGDLYGALEQYQAAAGLTGVDTTEARMRARLVTVALTPTPTPTPAPTP
ncbi:MAG: hypothetical protein D6790_14805, partial [Caldilineae bacterium]